MRRGEVTTTTETKPVTRGRRAPRWLLAGLGLLLVLAGGVIGGVIVAATQSSDTNSCSATNVAAKTLPSVVTIMVRNGRSGGTGSGEIIRSDGYILTNNHVISAAADGGSIEVLFSDGSTVPATLTGRDPQTDLAVIKVKSSESLPVIPFGSSNEDEVGQPVVALGAPLGLSSTVTTGIISALDRNIEVASDNGKTALLAAAIQTDAAINPGNSGGALTDCSGNLIGVPSAGASVPNESGGSSAGDVGLGFAIPVSTAESVSNEIISTGHVTHAYLGIQVAQIPPAAASRRARAKASLWWLSNQVARRRLLACAGVTSARTDEVHRRIAHAGNHGGAAPDQRVAQASRAQDSTQPSTPSTAPPTTNSASPGGASSPNVSMSSRSGDSAMNIQRRLMQSITSASAASGNAATAPASVAPSSVAGPRGLTTRGKSAGTDADRQQCRVSEGQCVDDDPALVQHRQQPDHRQMQGDAPKMSRPTGKSENASHGSFAPSLPSVRRHFPCPRVPAPDTRRGWLAQGRP